ncbi:hypothetical protein ONZ43_g3075 [Nemania bipapillata]|uniref:Uncharacterized protein n=1 Tax=Nemania bipapillata TaxID=110536 RepID=A0ACC2IY78_9PEZI|nr:hypothetical protein ONZ43_g3075 [Nemania bipapillata]
MSTHFTQNPLPSYRALPHTSEHVYNEQDFPLADFQSLRRSNIRQPQGSFLPNSAPRMPRPSWNSEGSSATRVGDIASNKARESPDSGGVVTRPAWLPYTLRWYCLTLILVFTAVLEILVVIVHVISARELGLVADDGSGSILILSKFVPTLFAVVHGIFLSILLNDVKRTQPFANLASPSGASARQSLTWTADGWWESMLASFPKRHARKPSWALLSLPLQANPIATTYFRTVSNILQNVTTSAWITDSYAVLPFWPPTMDSVPLGPMISADLAQTWSARTTVFSAEMNCEPMVLVESTPSDWFDLEFNFTISVHIVRLSSSSGCALNLTIPDETTLSATGGSVWTSFRSINITDFTTDFVTPFDVSGCSQDELIFLSKPLRETITKNASVVGQTCSTNYYMGEPSVTVVLSQSSSLVEIDVHDYSAVRKPIPSTAANLSSFETIFLNDTDWNRHLMRPLKSQRAFASGPAILLSAIYDYSPDEMFADPSFVESIGRVKQRFFGEQLHDVFSAASDSNTAKTTGTITDTRRRVVVVPSVAIILEVALLLQILLLITVLITTSKTYLK